MYPENKIEIYIYFETDEEQENKKLISEFAFFLQSKFQYRYPKAEYLENNSENNLDKSCCYKIKVFPYNFKDENFVANRLYFEFCLKKVGSNLELVLTDKSGYLLLTEIYQGNLQDLVEDIKRYSQLMFVEFIKNKPSKTALVE